MELMLFFFFFCLRHGRQRDWCGASAVSQRVSVRKRLRGEDHLELYLRLVAPARLHVSVPGYWSIRFRYIKWGNRTAPALRAHRTDANPLHAATQLGPQRDHPRSRAWQLAEVAVRYRRLCSRALTLGGSHGRWRRRPRR
jgi:hypothetical protein